MDVKILDSFGDFISCDLRVLLYDEDRNNAVPHPTVPMSLLP